jgi:hypothetical protein
VLRTSLKLETLDAAATVKAYKQLAQAERVFRGLNTVDMEARPIHHRRADRVRAHVYLGRSRCRPHLDRRQSPALNSSPAQGPDQTHR